MYQLRENYTLPYKLLQPEIEILKAITGNDAVNKRKDWIQDNIIIPLYRKHRKIFITCYTSFGKGYTFGKIVRGVNVKNPHLTHCFVSDALVINEQFRENYVQGWKLSKVEDFVINSYIKLPKGQKRVYDCVYFDELDRFCNGKEFKKAIPLTECKAMIGATATLTKQQIKFLESYGLVYAFDLPIEEAVLLGLVPDYRKLNLKVELSYKDRNLYASAQDEFNRYLDTFSQVWDTSTPYNLRKLMGNSPEKKKLLSEASEQLGWNQGAVFGCALKWQKASQTMERILGENPISIQKTVEIAKRLKGKTVIFAYNQKVADQINALLNLNRECSVAYHTGVGIKLRKENLKRFKENSEIQYIVCVRALNRGMDLPSLENGIQQFFNSTESASQQRFGRVCRYDVKNQGKSALLVSLYVDDFELRKTNYQSLLLRWLSISQRNQTGITWIETTEQIFTS